MRPAQSSDNEDAPTASAGDAIHSARPPFHLRFQSSSAAPREARAAVRAWMGPEPADVLLADALMVIGELVANSVRHAHAPADSPIGVHAEMGRGVLLLEVTDAGSSGAVRRRASDMTNGGGFGLNLVATLSRRWGVERTAGTRVWAELALAPTV